MTIAQSPCHEILKKYSKSICIRDCIPSSFLNKNNVIYKLQFGFRQRHSTSHALINITENIRKALDNENIDCGVFDTVDHQILSNRITMGFVEFQMIGLNLICLIAISMYP